MTETDGEVAPACKPSSLPARHLFSPRFRAAHVPLVVRHVSQGAFESVRMQAIYPADGLFCETPRLFPFGNRLGMPKYLRQHVCLMS